MGQQDHRISAPECRRPTIRDFLLLSGPNFGEAYNRHRVRPNAWIAFMAAAAGQNTGADWNCMV
jgi:hypothetical protein